MGSYREDKTSRSHWGALFSQSKAYTAGIKLAKICTEYLILIFLVANPCLVTCDNYAFQSLWG